MYIWNLNYKYNQTCFICNKSRSINRFCVFGVSQSPRFNFNVPPRRPQTKIRFLGCSCCFWAKQFFFQIFTHTNTHQSKSWTTAIFNLLSCLLNVNGLRKVKKTHLSWLVDWGKVVTLHICQGTFLDVSASPARNLFDRWPSHPQSCMMKHGPKDPESMYIQTSDPRVYLQRYTHTHTYCTRQTHVVM